ncbi:Protein of unknown function [Aeromonas sp. RU39B]|nr:Protein of unknown function [Aeromonas sp. RU39B]
METRLTQELASRFARLALSHLTREYPNELVLALQHGDELAEPRQLHPIFYGSYDWHSCVHGYWLLARLLGRFPDLPERPAILAVMAEHFTDTKVAGELAYFDHPLHQRFERPYGWAWLLALHGELAQSPEAPLRDHAAVLAPLANRLLGLLAAFLPKATYPVRVGTHFNTAFALALALPYCQSMGFAALAREITECAERWHLQDVACQAWEPSGDEFLSPSLMEAELMRRVLPADRFEPWLSAFLPALASGEPATLFTPASVSDRSDGKIAHLDGLNLSRAWCLRSLARALPEADSRHDLLLANAERHLAAALTHLAGDYMGEHWLATFALLALEA